MRLEESLTICLTFALGVYFVMYYTYWMDVWFLMTVDPFIVFNIWLEYGIRPGLG